MADFLVREARDADPKPPGYRDAACCGLCTEMGAAIGKLFYPYVCRKYTCRVDTFMQCDDFNSHLVRQVPIPPNQKETPDA